MYLDAKLLEVDSNPDIVGVVSRYQGDKEVHSFPLEVKYFDQEEGVLLEYLRQNVPRPIPYRQLLIDYLNKVITDEYKR